jgi:hypothetical protein
VLNSIKFCKEVFAPQEKEKDVEDPDIDSSDLKPED